MSEIKFDRINFPTPSYLINGESVKLPPIDIPIYGTRSVAKEEKKNVIDTVSLEICLDKYDKPTFEIAEDGEIIIRVGKLKIGGVK